MRPKAFHGRKQLSFSEKIANFAVYVYRHIHFMGQRYSGIPPAPATRYPASNADDLYRMGIALPDGRGSRRKSDTDAGLGPLGMGSPYPHVVHSLRVCLAAAALWSGSRRTIPATQTPTVEKDAGKGLLSHKHCLVVLWHQLAGSFTIVAFFALGCALGVSHRIPSLPAEAGFYALCLLLICVGLTVGQSNEIRQSLRRIDKRLMWLPVLTIVGTWAGAGATACLLQGRSFTDWLAISSGFGYIPCRVSSSRRHATRKWVPLPLSIIS